MTNRWENARRKAHARHGDPWTSHAAARSLDPDRLRDSQRAVLACFEKNGPMHHDQLVSLYSGRPQSESGLRTRTKELVDAGFLRASGKTVLLDSNRHSIIWELASEPRVAP